VTNDEQRRSQRYPADWSARYRLDGDDPWRDCRIADVSLDGAALEVHDATLVEGLDGPIDLQIISITGGDVAFTVRGVIRRRWQSENGQVMVGLEFSVLRAEERNLLHLLVGLRARP
jgi:hypothetical protein